MPLRDTTRFTRKELLDRFRDEIDMRNLDIEPYYNHENGLIGFKSPVGELGLYIERMIPDSWGTPAQFLLVDDSGTEMIDGSIYSVLNYITESVGWENVRRQVPDFEFVSDEPMNEGDWGKFEYNGKKFFVHIISGRPVDENDVSAGINHTTYVTDLNGISLKNLGELQDLSLSSSMRKLKRGMDMSDAKVVASDDEPKKIKAHRLSTLMEKAREPIEATAKIFDEKKLSRHLKEEAYTYRPYKKVIKITKMTAKEVADHKRWLRKTKAHRKIYAQRYRRKFAVRLERNEERRQRLHIKLKPHRPGYKFEYKR